MFCGVFEGALEYVILTMSVRVLCILMTSARSSHLGVATVSPRNPHVDEQSSLVLGAIGISEYRAKYIEG